ncbi:MAG TPA: M64 family metallopeptidase, partial [Candidatus Polarisedimenticolaceae bacterium]|nr:M64 family metallopeptidase [Candidatus Polarisedimenticolaceae bacterium]
MGMKLAALVSAWLLALPALAAPAHYVVFEVDAAGEAEPVFAARVELPARGDTVGAEAADAARARALAGEALRVLELRAPDGRVVFREVVALEHRLRGEFHGKPHPAGGHEIEAHGALVERAAFVARVPALAGARLVVDGPTRAEFDLDRLAARAGRLPLAHHTGGAAAVARGAAGDPTNRVDLVIMGDGYTAAESALFQAQAANLEDQFLSITPYAEYRNFVNVTHLFTASAESGADHPPFRTQNCTGDDPSCCSDPVMRDDPLRNTFVDTAFDARYCAFQIHRLLVIDVSAVLAAASAVPEWDQILVLVNDTTYGGSGGFIGVSSTHPAAVDVSRHEYGHSFTGLADEY